MKFKGKKILEYLEKHGPANTFRLSRQLEMDRHELIEIVKELTAKGIVEFKSGTVSKIENKLMKAHSQLKAESKPEKKEKTDTSIKEVGKPAKIKKQAKKPKIPKEQSRKKLHEKIRKETERSLAEREKSVREKERALEKREQSIAYALRKLKEDKETLRKEQENFSKKVDEAINLEKQKLEKTRKNLKKEKERISKAKILKEGISKLEATLEELNRKVSTKRRKLKQLKEKPKTVSKKIKRAREASFKPKIEKPVEKIGLSNIETEKPEIIPWTWQPEIEEEKIEDKFHDLIEQEISLLKQKRINEAREIHLKIKDMIQEVTDPEKRDIIIKDWHRIKEVY